jgi:hypothetical protein
LGEIKNPNRNTMNDETESSFDRISREITEKSAEEFWNDIRKIGLAGIVAIEILPDGDSKTGISHFHLQSSTHSGHYARQTSECYAAVDSLLETSHKVVSSGRSPLDTNKTDYRSKELKGSVNTWFILARK